MTSDDKRHLLTPGFWKTVDFGRLFCYAAFAGLLIAAVVMLGEEFAHHVGAIEAWLRAISPWGTVAFLALFVVLTSVFVPNTVMALIGGALFGVQWGTLAVVVGALLASSLQYFVSRHVLRDWITRKLSKKATLVAIMQAVKRHEIRLQVLLRLSPLSPTLGSYLLGAAGVPYYGFFLTSFALIPGLFLEVFFGHAGKHLTLMTTGDQSGGLSHDLLIIGGLIAGIAAIAIVSRMARKAVQAAAEAQVGSNSDAS